jgi:hypothetical protein
MGRSLLPSFRCCPPASCSPTRLFLYVAIVCGVLLTAGIVLTLLFLATVE